jgi:hypothetical protein
MRIGLLQSPSKYVWKRTSEGHNLMRDGCRFTLKTRGSIAATGSQPYHFLV